jgi:hypothetical protein
MIKVPGRLRLHQRPGHVGHREGAVADQQACPGDGRGESVTIPQALLADRQHLIDLLPRLRSVFVP